MIPNLIYDVGMYDGADTAYYLKKGYNVVSIEADPVLVHKASVKFKKYIAQNKLKIINQGIAAVEGNADFFVNEVNPFWNSFDESISARDQLPYHKITIKCNTFDNILKEYGVPYYLKIDIEGHDKFCLLGLNNEDLPQYVSFEADNEGNIDMLDITRDLGYKKFKCINQHTFLPLEEMYRTSIDTSILNATELLYFKLKAGQSIPMKVLRKLKIRDLAAAVFNPPPYLRFYRGSSGPFGDDLEGEWMSYDKVKFYYTKSYEDYLKNVKNTYGFWCDFHASR
jgi:FkbM family methyltransferase